MARERGKYVGTLGDLVRWQHDIRVTCRNAKCRHAVGPIDCLDLALAYGEWMSVECLMWRFRCAKCGTRYPEITVSVRSVSVRFDEAAPIPAPRPANVRP